MTKIVITARGEQIDFDLFMIKQQLGGQEPASATVKARQNFVDSKTNRRIRQALNKARGAIPGLVQQSNAAPATETQVVAVTPPVIVETPSVEEFIDETPPDTMVDETPTPPITQKARRK